MEGIGSQRPRAPPKGDAWHPGVPNFVAEAIYSIPPCYMAILRYLTHFNALQDHKFRGVINGGFVRDLLSNKQSDDLDVTFDLRLCRDGVSIGDLLIDLAAFSQSHSGEFGIREVTLVEIIGDAEKGKTVDVTKAMFEFVDAQQPTIVVDVMPVLSRAGSKSTHEVTMQEDAFRRDLTINALLLEFSDQNQAPTSLLGELLQLRAAQQKSAHARGGGDGDALLDHESVAVEIEEFPFRPKACVMCHGLRWTLLDFVGGFRFVMLLVAFDPWTGRGCEMGAKGKERKREFALPATTN